MMSGDGDHEVATRAERVIAGRYLLHDVLGSGGMGTVWRAHDQLLDRPVAAKELHILANGDEDHRVRVRRAVREARAVARYRIPTWWEFTTWSSPRTGCGSSWNSSRGPHWHIGSPRPDRSPRSGPPPPACN
ncbi:hypothetical protein [Streptomyces sp. NPDC058145]|uniref:hypothetical protein n=1 Tax=Streptomyces sp. NPDC058145 TaxID=3346356 RepID=UPI0036E8AA40